MRIAFTISDAQINMNVANSGDHKPVPDCFMCRKPAGQYHSTIQSAMMRRTGMKPKALCAPCTNRLEDLRETFYRHYPAAYWASIELWPNHPPLKDDQEDEA
jgi:hypothetical protein